MTVITAVDALRDTWRNALIVAGLLHDPQLRGDVQVFDGPDANRQLAGRSVTVAAAFEDDQDAVTVAYEERGARPTVTEVVDVACSIYVGSGDGIQQIQDHRTDAGAILLVLTSALSADRTLGGLVHSVRIASTSWMQGRDEQGTGVAVGLVVNMRRMV